MSKDLEVNNVSKKYKHYASHWARLAEWLSAAKYCCHTDKWALKNISLQVQAGESLGIIGQNGAGKSTLLKILTGTTLPTEGSFRIVGPVAALLELGMGFHPNFSGKQNAVMACQMSGEKTETIRELLPEIETFSELGDYFNQPLRVYSTGMQMRLAFSAATVVRPNILIVDEALSVGDIYFQHKCIQRIREFRQQGTTLLFVSHDSAAMKSLCGRVILLHKGSLIRDGIPDVVLDYYNGMVAQKEQDQELKQTEIGIKRQSTRSGSGKARIQKVDIQNSEAKSTRAFRVGDSARIRCEIGFNTEVENPTVGVLIRDRLGNDVFGTNTYHLDASLGRFHGGDKLAVVFCMPLNIGCGSFSLSVAVHSGHTHMENNLDWWDQSLVFEMIPDNSFSFIGSTYLPMKVEFERIT
jgi:lipopolysaccharide transport system ATP-binding protein